MTQNPYKAPDAALSDGDGVADQAGDALLYVVSPAKFWLLMIGTFGMYSLYWFYRNWSLLNRKHGGYWPVPRAVFAIFFTHSLFHEIDHLLSTRRIAFAWWPAGMASMYVVSAIGMQMGGPLARAGIISDATDAILSLALTVPMLWSIFAAQRASNAAEGDPQGRGNASITAVNIVWLAIGACLWLLVLLGLAAVFFDVQME